MLEMMIHFENLKHPHKLPDHLVKERLASGVRCSASGSTFYIFWRFCQPLIWRSFQEITQLSQLNHLQEKAKTYKRLASSPPGVFPSSEGVLYRDHRGLASHSRFIFQYFESKVVKAFKSSMNYRHAH
ncbi:hypothetical protein [Zymobacter sp. IVIA_12111.31 C1]|uniref:hypothetical protein n=1 Tax=Zymobacter sp. IVIA_12111.31 C1 TaxID=3394854 RepID=UPI0039C06614